MSVTGIESIVERLQHGANVRSVFGEPIERGDRTVVPVARVSYGFGGGFGRGGSDASDESGDQRTLDGEVVGRGGTSGGRGGGGGGGGGGASATPVGALEITDEGTRFVRIESRKRSAAALLAGVAVGVLVGRRSRRD